jgi:hypothetical protein
MKPIITAVSMPPTGGVVGSSQPVTLQVDGGMYDNGVRVAGFGHDLDLIFAGGPIPTQVIREPGAPGSHPGDSTLQLSDTGAIATVNVPAPLQGSPSNPTGKVWAVSGGMVSDEFDFPVGKG